LEHGQQFEQEHSGCVGDDLFEISEDCSTESYRITEVETINGRPGLRMAVRRRPKSVGAGLAYGL